MVRLLIRWIISTLAILAAAAVVPGVHVQNWVVAAVVAVIFGLVNALVRPLVLLLTCPLVLVTLGLFTLVVNAGMFLLSSWISGVFNLGFSVDGLVPAFLGALVVSVVSLALTLLVGDKKSEERRRAQH